VALGTILLLLSDTTTVTTEVDNNTVVGTNTTLQQKHSKKIVKQNILNDLSFWSLHKTDLVTALYSASLHGLT